MHRCVVEFATAVSKGALRSVVDTLIELDEINESVLQRRVSHHHSKELLRRLLREAAVHLISAPRLAGMLEGASCVVEYHQELSPELVWTGPVPEGTATRQTEQVLLEVIRGARKRLFLTSFVAYKVERIITALNEAADRGVDVKILLESSEANGGNLSLDSVSMMTTALPRARFYTWQIRPEEFTGGSVHAKVAVADDRLAFITSANLTGYAMQRNMEAGVLLRGGAQPRKLAEYLESMVSTGLVEEL